MSALLRRAAVLVLTLLALVQALPVTAQTAPPPSPPQQVSGPPQQVSGPEISFLIRSTLVALHQANITGNYTVLRDLGASVLRDSNTAADLAAQFGEFRQKRIGLAGVVLNDAVLDDKPHLSTDGALRLVGHFPLQPAEVVFDLTYLWERGDWRIAQIRVATRPGKPATPAQPGTPAKPVAPKPAPKPAPKAVPVPKPAPK